MKSFTIAVTPKLIFGEGRFSSLVSLFQKEGWKNVLVVTGKSFPKTTWWSEFITNIEGADITHQHFINTGEPSPETIDSWKASIANSNFPEAVVAIGGGSAVDAGKALAASIMLPGSIKEYLEGVGDKQPDGKKVPFIAVPTTAGTGSEATKNAVLSNTGEGGFKKSLRHDNYVPDIALIDPNLHLSCPASVTAASGMDAITQLLEAYASTGANPFTDPLALQGLEIAGKYFLRAVQAGSVDIEARSGMAYAAYLSGVCLANAGLGVVHGAASPAGALFSVPHGVFCGTLVGEACRATVAKLMRVDDNSDDTPYKRYARAGVALSGKDADSLNGNAGLLVMTLETMIKEAEVERLGVYGIDESGAMKIAEKTSMKNHPCEMDIQEVFEIIKKRI